MSVKAARYRGGLRNQHRSGKMLYHAEKTITLQVEEGRSGGLEAVQQLPAQRMIKMH
jgi:hypothetical protein